MIYCLPKNMFYLSPWVSANNSHIIKQSTEGSNGRAQYHHIIGITDIIYTDFIEVSDYGLCTD